LKSLPTAAGSFRISISTKKAMPEAEDETTKREDSMERAFGDQCVPA
jgi:hypothetical protein